MYSSKLFLNDLKKLLEIENQLPTPKKFTEIDFSKALDIEFINVSFKYPGTDKYVFRNLNISIKSGEDIAIVGKKGAGKPTFVKLVLRFYDPTEGVILVNVVDLREINQNKWHKLIGALFQEFNQYGFSFETNVYLGNVDVKKDEAKFLQAISDTGAKEIGEGLKMKFQTPLGRWFKNGTELSGGQWQRVALARGFYRDAPILILDEPTSAIDAKGEEEIFEKISLLNQDKTTIIISHRFSTVIKAHKIYVFDNGEIIEQGSHDELMSNTNSVYYDMFTSQAK